MKFTDLLERVGWTAVQVFLGTWLALQEGGGGWDSVAFKVAGAAAILDAVKVLVLSGYNPHPGSNPALDVLKRVGWTALLAGAGAWLALAQDGNAWNAGLVLTVLRNAAVASLIKSILALNVGRKDSAALLPASVDS
jgi:hypothetical protein